MFPLISGVVARPLVPMSKHTALRTGGPADEFVVVHRRQALGPALAALAALGARVIPLGCGTQARFRDGRVAAAVVQLGCDFARVHIQGTTLTAGAAVPLPVLVGQAARAGLAGLEALAGRPGSLGGALAQAGQAPWHEVLDQVYRMKRGAEVALPLAKARRGSPLFTGARFVLRPDDSAAIARRVARARQACWQGDSSPWFAHPQGASVRSELARVQFGGVRLRQVIAPKAAPELLVNLGVGGARDLELLQQSAIERVYRLRGITLVARGSWMGQRGLPKEAS